MSAATATTTAEYELVLMLDPELADERRDQIADEARARITSGGEMKHDQPWGMRKMAYEIRQRTEADYRFFRFEAPGPVLDELDHSLKITDGVLRFRIFKVDPRSPVIEPPPPVSLVSSGRSAPPRRGGPGGRPRRDAVETEAPDSPPAEAPPEPTPAQEPTEAPPAPDSPPIDEPAEPTPAPETPDSPPTEAEQSAPADAPQGDEPSN
jgi:small subunit ribosomal protein S6